MVGEWALSVGAFYGEQQLVDFGQIIGWQSTFDVQMGHNAQAIGVTR
jgi:hypothetical protein